ncbi:LPS export ABC transporter permease LptF [Marilutibacter alkalisoli]|uniref:Lipopolysaccharide export system permease protein LptF n=1 Tax=Marilutibacter alkalisoli TaxID=2591633 RepID=A0A514BUC0_9GAMM|nr:LPS export ABC transporter permease LptF [Lysobacter alkalisoli]QDH71004.1 LPS export ABC transporter permease LptF [Lysobacter alkalisoli]
MPKLDRYLLGEFAQAVLATLTVLLIVCVGGALTDVLGDIARGRVPAGLLLAQLGLVLLNWLPVIMPLALMLGLMMAMGRLYRDAEMPVIASIGVGPRRMLKPLLWVMVPLVAVVAACSLWLGPWAERLSRELINEANRNTLVAGLEPGRFTELPGGGGVAFVGEMTGDGRRFDRVFVYRQSDDRINVTTSNEGLLKAGEDGERYLVLNNGFEVEGPRNGGQDYRLMRYASNEVRMPPGKEKFDLDEPKALPTVALVGDPRPEAVAQLHRRLAPPLLALAFALMAIPLARSMPRQARYGPMLMGFLGYLIGVNLMLVGSGWLAKGTIPPVLGLWWLVLPLLVVGVWLYSTDGRMRRPRVRA